MYFAVEQSPEGKGQEPNCLVLFKARPDKVLKKGTPENSL